MWNGDLLPAFDVVAEIFTTDVQEEWAVFAGYKPIVI
jgi:hypothetical protein